MSKITNDGLTRSGTVCFIAVPIWQQWASNGFILLDMTDIQTFTDKNIAILRLTETAPHINTLVIKTTWSNSYDFPVHYHILGANSYIIQTSLPLNSISNSAKCIVIDVWRTFSGWCMPDAWRADKPQDRQTGGRDKHVYNSSVLKENTHHCYWAIKRPL